MAVSSPPIRLPELDTAWARTKTFIEHMVGVSNDAVHVLAGVALLFLFAALLRRSVASPWPWLLLFACELLNEWHDLRVEVWPDRAMQWGEGAKDVLVTMAIPTLLLVLARWRPAIFTGARPGNAAQRRDPGDGAGDPG